MPFLVQANLRAKAIPDNFDEIQYSRRVALARQVIGSRLDAPPMEELAQPKSPETCADMREVRLGVDTLDRQLVALIARRFAYMDAAARIKTDRSSVRDEARKAEVLANVRRAAIDSGIPADVVTQLWETLVEGSIAYELDRWDGLRR